MDRKYEFTGEEKTLSNGVVLHRIRAVRNFTGVVGGELGGWIEKEENLSHEGGCWVGEKARVYERARVGGCATVCGKAYVDGNSEIRCNADIKSMRDYITFKNWWSSGQYFTWTRSNDKWKVGCFYGSGEELIKKAYQDSELSGREYERVVKYVEAIKEEYEKENN